MTPDEVNLEHLRGFVELAACHDYSRAARRLKIGQPALSARMRAFETALRFELRSTRRRGAQFDLTDAGRLLLERAMALLSAVADFSDQAGKLAEEQKKGGNMVLVAGGATASDYLLPRVLGKFTASHSDVRVHVHAHKSKGIVDLVRAGKYDFGIVTGGLALVPGREADTSDIERATWITDYYQLVCPSNHRLVQNRGFRWEDLDDEKFWMLADSGVKDVLMAGAPKSYSGEMNVVGELPTIRAILEAVRARAGLGFITTSVSGSSKNTVTSFDGLSLLPCLDGEIARELVLVRQQQQERPMGADALWRYLLNDAR